MNDQQMEKKVNQDAIKVKKDLGTLAGDVSTRVSSLGRRTVEKAREKLSAAVDDSSTQLSEGFEKLSTGAKEKVVDAAETIRIGLEQGSRRYNADAQEIVNRIPGSIGKKAARYPWVTVSIALVMGLLLGGLLKSIFTPSGHRHG